MLCGAVLPAVREAHYLLSTHYLSKLFYMFTSYLL